MIESSLRDASSLSDKVGTDLKKYVEEKKSLETEAKKAHDIIELKQCTTGVKEAFSKDNLQLAAKFIIKYTQFEKLILDTDTISLFEDSKKTLIERIEKKINQCIDSKDIQTLLEYCKILKDIGHEDLSTDMYLKYHKSTIDSDITMINASVNESRKDQKKDAKISYSDGIAQLLARYHKRVKKQYNQLLAIYGPVTLADILLRVQHLLNEYCTQLLEALSREWPEIDQVKRNLELANVVMYAPLLEQLVYSSYNLETHNLFVISVLNQIKKTSSISMSEDESVLFEKAQSKIEKNMKQSKLNQMLHGILDVYISIEEKYMVENIQIIMKDLGDATATTSNNVDDIFFVIKESSERALSTYNINTVCAVVNNIATILKGTLMKMLDLTFQDRNTRSRKIAMDIPTAFNQLEESCNNIIRLSTDIDRGCSKIFIGNMKPIKACLDELSTVEKSIRTRLKGNIEKFAINILCHAIDDIEKMDNVNYNLTEAQYSQYQVNDPFMEQYIRMIDIEISDLREHLSPNNIDSIINFLARKLSNKLEKLIFQKRFNILGAIQLDKDVRSLFSYLSSISQQNLRDRFSRINQIVYFLNMESLSEVEEAWKDRSQRQSGWSLNLTEIRKLLMVRVDFSKESIAKMAL